MTIKQWFYRHVNVTMVLLLLMLVFSQSLTWRHIEEGDWFLAAVWFVISILWVNACVRWWRERQ